MEVSAVWPKQICKMIEGIKGEVSSRCYVDEVLFWTLLANVCIIDFQQNFWMGHMEMSSKGIFLLLWRCDPTRVMSSLLMFLDHTQWRTTVGSTSLDEWSALPDNTQHSQQTNFYAPGGIRTHDLSRRAAAGCSPAEIVGTNPTGGMDICLLWVSCVVR